MAESPLRALEAGGEALTACFVLSLLRVTGVGDFSVGGCFSPSVFAFLFTAESNQARLRLKR